MTSNLLFPFFKDQKSLFFLFSTFRGDRERERDARPRGRSVEIETHRGEWQRGRIAGTPNVTSRRSYLFAIISARLVSIGLLWPRYPSQPIQKYYAIFVLSSPSYRGRVERRDIGNNAGERANTFLFRNIRHSSRVTSHQPIPPSFPNLVQQDPIRRFFPFFIIIILIVVPSFREMERRDSRIASMLCHENDAA